MTADPATRLVIASPGQFAVTAAASIAELMGAAISRRKRCSLALCGGTTPAAVYGELSRTPIDWANVSIFFGDERAVPPTHPDSNFGMAQRALLSEVPVESAQVRRMECERADIAAAAREYDRALPPRLDVLLLGVGTDGHTASIFPGTAAAIEFAKRVIAVASPPMPAQPQVPRMTITPAVIATARQVIVMVCGGEKAAILEQILDGPDQPEALPAQLARRGIWIVDQAAAAQLQPRES